MNEKFYVVEVTTNSTGTETRKLTPYDNNETALRKFYEPLNSIGAGPIKICVGLYDENLTEIKREVWMQAVDETPEEIPTEE